MGKKNPKGFKNLLQSLIYYQKNTENKENLLEILKQAVSKNTELIEDLNQNLKVENKLEVVP